jgi:hypothetical protein
MLDKARLHLGGRRPYPNPCAISGEFSDVASIAQLYDWNIRNDVLSQ